MGLPATSWLEPKARQRVEARLRAIRGGIVGELHEVEGPVAAMLVFGAAGTLRAVAKGGLILAGVVESLAAGRPQALLAVPRVAVSLLGATTLLGLGKVVAAAQTALGVEPEGRPLDPREQSILRLVFHDGLDLEPLRVKEGPAGLATTFGRPFVHGEVLYLGSWPLRPGMLVHEAVHWWQHQHGGPDYMIDSLWSQCFGAGYDWRRSVPGTAWADLETEQQAALIEAIFEAGFFETGRFVADGQDLSLVARAALHELRAGRGAP